MPCLLAELARAPELWIQKGYLTRVVTVDRDQGIRDQGFVPLAHFVDSDGGDACAVAVEYDADGTVVPVVYIRQAGRLTERSMPAHALHRFDTDEHRDLLTAYVEPLLTGSAMTSSR